MKTYERIVVITLVAAAVLSAVYAVYTSNRDYSSKNPTYGRTTPAAGSPLRTGASSSQPSNANGQFQLQTGSSGVQQAAPNSPQSAGASNPLGPLYCDGGGEVACAVY